MKKAISLVLVMMLMITMLCGCESEADRREALVGCWVMDVQATEEETMDRLENIELYEEEMVLAEGISLTYVEQIEFDGYHYRIGFAVDETKEHVREFYRNIIEKFYENRTMLNEVYQQDFGAMTEAEFKQFYATMYSQENYEDMIDYFADIAFVYEEAFDSGYYTTKGKRLQITRDDVTKESGELDYKIEGNTLTMTYSDAIDIYTRSDG